MSTTTRTHADAGRGVEASLQHRWDGALHRGAGRRTILRLDPADDHAVGLSLIHI